MKRLFLELGGKSADIVLDDADLESKMGMASHGLRARRPGLRHADPHARATARATTRRSRSRRRASQNFPYGDPTDAGNLQGPQISAKQRERVLGYIEKGKEEGARVVAGGGRPDALRQGLVRRSRRSSPTSTNDMTIAREEIFGPVLARHPVRRRRRRRAHRQRQPVRPRRLRHLRLRGAGPGRRPASSGPAPSASTAASSTAPTPRSAATRPAASAARAASRASSSTPRPRPIGVTVPPPE